jgi:hypothetical protein
VGRLSDHFVSPLQGLTALREPIFIKPSRASKSAICAVEQRGGGIICQYYNALALRDCLKGRTDRKSAAPTRREDIGQTIRCIQRPASDADGHCNRLVQQFQESWIPRPQVSGKVRECCPKMASNAWCQATARFQWPITQVSGCCSFIFIACIDIRRAIAPFVSYSQAQQLR